MCHTPALDSVFRRFGGTTVTQQCRHLFRRAGTQAGDEAVKHQHKRQYGDQIREDEGSGRAQLPGKVRREDEDTKSKKERGDDRTNGPILKLKDASFCQRS